MGAVRVAVIVLLVLVALLAAVVGALRYRKLRRDELRIMRSRGTAQISPPPSPYEISRGVRLLDADSVPVPRPQPVRPRLDPDRPYVFSESGPYEADHSVPVSSRHDERWALERSSHRSRIAPGSGRVLIIVAAALVALIGVGAYLQHSPSKHPVTTTTSTTSTTSTTTTTLAPG